MAFFRQPFWALCKFAVNFSVAGGMAYVMSTKVSGKRFKSRAQLKLLSFVHHRLEIAAPSVERPQHPNRGLAGQRRARRSPPPGLADHRSLLLRHQHGHRGLPRVYRCDSQLELQLDDCEHGLEREHREPPRRKLQRPRHTRRFHSIAIDINGQRSVE